MKTLIFSDTHLDLSFDEKKFRFLEKLIQSSDKVVINGDFWEGYLLTFKQFIASPWRKLFPLLKKKKAIYIFGNHDRGHFADKETNLFSDVQKLRHEISTSTKKFIIEHGDRLMPSYDMKMTNPALLKVTTLWTDALELYFIKKLGFAYVHNFMKGFNKKIKGKLKKELKKNEIYVCGHTHCFEVDEANQFINTGFVRYGIGQYMMIEDEKFYLKEEFYNK